MRRLKVGLIGLGAVADLHLEAYRMLREIEVTSGAELRKDRRDQISSNWGITGYTDYIRMLETEHLDIVCILTPPANRREITVKAAEFGCHILCEKPMALTLDDARAMVERCESLGV